MLRKQKKLLNVRKYGEFAKKTKKKLKKNLNRQIRMEEVSLTEKETRYFSDLFSYCDVEKTGKVPMSKAAELFETSNLSDEVIRQVTIKQNVNIVMLSFGSIPFQLFSFSLSFLDSR